MWLHSLLVQACGSWPNALLWATKESMIDELWVNCPTSSSSSYELVCIDDQFFQVFNYILVNAPICTWHSTQKRLWIFTVCWLFCRWNPCWPDVVSLLLQSGKSPNVKEFCTVRISHPPLEIEEGTHHRIPLKQIFLTHISLFFLHQNKKT